MSKINDVPDLTGRRFGRLVVIGIESTGKHKFWLCQCDCGETRKIQGSTLLKGIQQSCGCLMREMKTSHGKAYSRAYRTWLNMLDRCENPRSRSYKSYGARGITVAPEWRSFPIFYAAMGDAPDGMSLDRIDNDGGYFPENCRWATAKLQLNNRRSSKRIEFRGRVMTMSQWADELGLDYALLKDRLRKGWTFERAISGCSGRRSASRPFA